MEVGGATRYWSWSLGVYGYDWHGGDQIAWEPGRIVDGPGFEQVWSSDSAHCGLTPAGEAYCWGFTSRGLSGSSKSTGEICSEVDSDRVREHTADEINRRIDHETRVGVQVHASGDDNAIGQQIEKLEQEWDAERLLMTNASIFALSGLVLGAFVNRRWLLLPGAVLPFLLQHAVQGWCPPLPVLRRVLGVRTRKEIDREKFALKAVRGDFDSKHPGSSDPAKRTLAALAAVGR